VAREDIYTMTRALLRDLSRARRRAPNTAQVPPPPTNSFRFLQPSIRLRYDALLQLLCTVGSNQARLDARTEFEISQRSPKGGKLVVHIIVLPLLNSTTKKITKQ
jgi:hypothetical protein